MRACAAEAWASLLATARASRVARIYAACALALDRQTPPQATVDTVRERREFADKAVETLREAIRLQPSQRQVILTPDVNPIRSHPRFDELLKTARE